MNLNFRNKKGNVIDLAFIVIILFGVSLALFFIYHSYYDVSTELISSGDLGVDGTAVLQDSIDSFYKWNDNGIGFIFFGLIIGVLVTAYFIDVHPVFFVISLIMFIFLIFASVYISNTFQEIVNDSEFSVTVTKFPITVFIHENLILLLILTFVLMSVIMYGKSRNSQGSGGYYG